MKIKACIFVVGILALFTGPHVQADSTANREYQIKAAFLYNFLMFIDWPKEKMSDDKEPIILGIIGKDPFENAFEPVKDKLVNNRKVVVKRFKPFEELKKSDKAVLDQEIEAIRKCHMLYICSSEDKAKTVKEITDLVKGHSVLTVGSVENFDKPENRIINFLVEEDKIRFEIDIAAAREAKLQIRSQLLRLAKKITGEEPIERAKD